MTLKQKLAAAERALSEHAATLKSENGVITAELREAQIRVRRSAKRFNDVIESLSKEAEIEDIPIFDGIVNDEPYEDMAEALEELSGDALDDARDILQEIRKEIGR